MAYLTAEEVHARYISAMGPDLGPLFHGLHDECADLHWKWGQYVILFGTKASRIDLLNQAAGAFFRLVQDSLWEMTLLHIARLTEPASGKRKAEHRNLTISALRPMLEPDLQRRIRPSFKNCKKKSAFAHDWRHRHIAHRDRELAIDDSNARPLAHASRLAVAESLSSIASLLNEIEEHYCESETAYSLAAPVTDAESLLFVLRDGVAADSDRRKRISDGRYTLEDLQPPLEI